MDGINSINTVTDVAKFLQVSETTIYRLVQSGKLKSIKALGKTRITRKAVEELIES